MISRKTRKTIVTIVATAAVLAFITAGLTGNLNSAANASTASTEAAKVNTKGTKVERFLALNNEKRSFRYHKFDAKPISNWPVITFKGGAVEMTKNGSNQVTLYFKRIKAEGWLTSQEKSGKTNTEFTLRTNSGEVKIPAGSKIRFGSKRSYSYRIPDRQYACITFTL